MSCEFRWHQRLVGEFYNSDYICQYWNLSPVQAERCDMYNRTLTNTHQLYRLQKIQSKVLRQYHDIGSQLLYTADKSKTNMYYQDYYDDVQTNILASFCIGEEYKKKPIYWSSYYTYHCWSIWRGGGQYLSFWFSFCFSNGMALIYKQSQLINLWLSHPIQISTK